jgi:ABC-2 type transport system ATP-binding protein
MAEDALLEVSNVSKQFNQHTALDQVSLSVPRGSIHGLLGPNGAGKTTLIRIINKIIGPDQGEVFLAGRPVRQADVEKIGYLPEERGLYPKMSVGEHLVYLARLKGLSRQKAYDAVRSWLQEFDILNWWWNKVEELSKGMAQKLQFIATVVHQPYFIILDEPFSGFDPINAEVVKQKIMDLKNQGTTIMLSTHRMENVETMCEYVALINKAQKVLDGSIEEIKASYRNQTYEVTLSGKVSETAIPLGVGMHLHELTYHSTTNQSIARLEVEQAQKPNSLIRDFMERHEIEGFREVIPSMHDIFLANVQEAETHEEGSVNRPA